MKMRTRLASLALSVCLLCSLAVPVGAASTTTSFSDVSSSQLSASVETLRLLGVLDGYADGSFRPNGNLTRGQFCKMAVYAMNGESQLGLYKSVTVFPDVKPSYWASAYVNMASKGKNIIYGYPDGNFYPNRAVTYGQAVTILMRLLGYADTDVGAVWPDGYLAMANTIGLTDGVQASASVPLTRAQAATLFANLLATEVKDGSNIYGATIAGSAISDVVLLSSSAKAPDGTGNAMKFSNNLTYKMADTPSNGALNGRKGTLLLDKAGRVMTFVPLGAGSSRTVTISLAKSGALTDSTGAEHTIDSGVEPYAVGDKSTYGSVYGMLSAGMTATLYYGSSGAVEYVYVGGGETSGGAVIVMSDKTATGLSELAGTSTYSIIKNGVKADAGDLRKYDVAVFDAASNAVRVSDTRIAGYYEDCAPTAAAPETVTVLGHTFHVLSTAAASFADIKLGTQVTLLLTPSNEVAGVVTTSAATATGNAVGLATSVSTSSATVQLLCGITVKGDPKLSADRAGDLTGQLVRVSSTGRGTLSLSKLTGKNSSDLDVTGRKLGTASLADNVAVYEKVNASALTAITLGNIRNATVSGGDISYVGRDWAGRVNLLILDDVTGDSYTYGLANYTKGAATTTVTEDKDGNKVEHTTTGQATVSVEYGNGQQTAALPCNYNVRDGDFIGVVATADGSKIASLKQLTQYAKVPASAWNGSTMVTAGGQTHPVVEDVPCYNSASKSWMTLTAARAYASTLNLYADEHGVIRVIEVR